MHATIAVFALVGIFCFSESMTSQERQPAGSEACATCHEDLALSFKKNDHQKLETARGRPPGQACESCHGPGSEHVDTLEISTIRSFKSLAPQASQGACLDCHAKEGTHANRLFDTHTRRAVTCTQCHSIHGASESTHLLARPTHELCGSCHATERAAFERPFSHRLRQGAMTCVDCHAPHGSPLSVQTRSSHVNQATCVSCHGDKRGPFAFEHMPAKVGDCASCHEVHGSFNPRMLVRHEARQVCLECHTNSTAAFGRTPPAFHDLRSDRIRNCTICHTKIHGSHISRALLR